MASEKAGALSGSMSDRQEIDLVDEILGRQTGNPMSPVQASAVPWTATDKAVVKDDNSKFRGATPDTAPVQTASAEVAPAETLPVDDAIAQMAGTVAAVAPVEIEPAEVEPADVAVVPADDAVTAAAPVEIEPAAVAAAEATTAEATPSATEALPPESPAAPPETASAEPTTIAEAVPVETAPVEAAPVEAVAAGAVSAEIVPAEAAVEAPATDIPHDAGRRLHVPNPLHGIGSIGRGAAHAWGRKRSYRLFRFAIGFVVAGAACLLLLVAIAAGFRSAYSDKVVPGVRVGSVDVSGLTQDQVVAKLQTAYAYLSQGEVTVTTASGTAQISYQQTGRSPDVNAMAYEAMRVGHTGNPLADTVAMLRSAVNGEAVPIVVSLDPQAVATQVRQLVSTDKAPKNAAVTSSGGSFQLLPGTDGKGIDEVAISQAIVDHLTQPDQSADFAAGGAFIDVKPAVTDADAQTAIADGQKMLVDINLTWTKPAPPTPTPSPAASGSASASATPTATPTPAPTTTAAASPTEPPVTKNYTIDSATVASWISFGFDATGKYDASVDVAKIQSTIGSMNLDVTYAPVEPTVIFDTTGKPYDVTGGAPGAGLDITATANNVADYLKSLEAGGGTRPVDIVTAPISPELTAVSLQNMVIIGAHTTTFYPDISNGYGANIAIPATALNGQVVFPGQQFSFLQRVGPIDAAHGYLPGGVIIHGKSDHTGAIGGGICSASTTAFNAAADAGLQIDERHAHAYYINRYPVGLDATVFSNGYETYDMKWTNDTPNPIVIHAWATTHGSTRKITVQLWSLPLDRTVVYSAAYQANVIKATDSTVYTTAIPVGTKNRAEYPTDGFSTSRTRTVTDASGNVIHKDTWNSHYVVVDGILEIGVKSTPAPTQGPSTPAPQPSAPAPTPTTAAAIAPRRRPDDEAEPAA